MVLSCVLSHMVRNRDTRIVSTVTGMELVIWSYGTEIQWMFNVYVSKGCNFNASWGCNYNPNINNVEISHYAYGMKWNK